MISGWYPQILKLAGDLQLPEFSARHIGNVHETLERNPAAKASVSAHLKDLIMRHK